MANRELEREAQPREAGLMLAQGVSLRTVSEHLGHAGLAISADLCVHLGEAQRPEATEALKRAVIGR